MAWENPKLDWKTNPKNPVPADFNRIESNIEFLKGDIETKKGAIVDAINDMNQPAEITDTHAQLASKIRDISKDATAAVGDVEKGKTFYAGGEKRTGTLELTGNAAVGDVLAGKTFYNTSLKTKHTGTIPNRGAVVITPGTTNQTIAAGYHNGQGYVKGDANLVPGSILAGKNIFGVAGNQPKVLVGGGVYEPFSLGYGTGNLTFSSDGIGFGSDDLTSAVTDVMIDVTNYTKIFYICWLMSYTKCHFGLTTSRTTIPTSWPYYYATSSYSNSRMEMGSFDISTAIGKYYAGCAGYRYDKIYTFILVP